MVSSPPYNRLPPDITLRILNFAAGSSKASCLTLCLVSWRTRRIAIPHLLSTVILTDDVDTQAFANCIRSVNTPASSPNDIHLAQLVRSLWLPRGQGDRMATHILSSLGKLTNLAITSESFAYLVAISSFQSSISLRPRDLRLTVCTSGDLLTSCAPPPSQGSQLCDMVTHVRFGDPLAYGIARQIQCFPRLTHLAIPFDSVTSSPDLPHDTFSVLEQVLYSRTLTTFVLVMHPDEVTYTKYAPSLEAWIRRTRAIDPRVYFTNASRCRLQKEWKEEADGGESIWERAARETCQWETSPQLLRRRRGRGNLSSAIRSQVEDDAMEL